MNPEVDDAPKPTAEDLKNNPGWLTAGQLKKVLAEEVARIRDFGIDLPAFVAITKIAASIVAFTERTTVAPFNEDGAIAYIHGALEGFYEGRAAE